MHILPTRGRPKGLQRFFDEGKPEQPGVVVIEKDQRAIYADVQLPANWQMLVRDERGGYVASANAVFDAFPNEPWYQMSSDDCVGRTPHWDTLLTAAAGLGGVAWPNDLYDGAGRCTFPCVGGDLCRAAGWFVYPKLWHMWSDTVWWQLSKKLKLRGGYQPDIVLEHMHYGNGKANYDATYHGRIPRKRRDGQGLCRLGKMPADYDRTTYAAIDWDELMARFKCAL